MEEKIAVIPISGNDFSNAQENDHESESMKIQLEENSLGSESMKIQLEENLLGSESMQIQFEENPLGLKSMKIQENPLGSESMQIQFEKNPLGLESNSNEENETVCRICQLSDVEAPNLGKLKQPCDCSGTMQLVHEFCLLQWVRTTRRLNCEVCRKRFSIVRLRFLPILRWQVSNDELIHLIFSGIYWQFFGYWIYKMFTTRKPKDYEPKWWFRWFMEPILIGNIFKGAWVLLQKDFQLFRDLVIKNSEYTIENVDSSQM